LNGSAPACQKWYIFLINLNIYLASFQNLTGTIRFNIILDMASTCCKSCDPSKSSKLSWIHFWYIFQMNCHCFGISAIRRSFSKLIKNAIELSQHEALEGAHVHELRLCVTFGALRFRTDFGVSMRCSKFIWMSTTLGTLVSHTALYVTFGARRPPPRADPLPSAWRPFGPPTFTQGCPPELASACPQPHPDLRSSIFRRRVRHAHEVARGHKAGSGDRENPKWEWANIILGSPVMTGPP